jgi:hypothetical protein
MSKVRKKDFFRGGYRGKIHLYKVKGVTESDKRTFHSKRRAVEELKKICFKFDVKRHKISHKIAGKKYHKIRGATGVTARNIERNLNRAGLDYDLYDSNQYYDRGISQAENYREFDDKINLRRRAMAGVYDDRRPY